MTKISLLPTDSAPTLTDFIPSLDQETSTTKKFTLQKLRDLFSNNPSNPYKFYVYRDATAYSAANGAMTKMPLNAKKFDTNNNFDVTTNFRYTTPVSGFYFFQGKVNFGASTTRGIATIGVNGLDTYRGQDTAQSAGELSALVVVFIQLTAGDTVELDYYTTPGGNLLNAGTGTYFTGFLVSL